MALIEYFIFIFIYFMFSVVRFLPCMHPSSNTYGVRTRNQKRTDTLYMHTDIQTDRLPYKYNATDPIQSINLLVAIYVRLFSRVLVFTQRRQEGGRVWPGHGIPITNNET